KALEAPAPSGPGDPPAPEHTEGPAVPGGDQTAPAHAEPAAGEHTQQTVLPDMGEDAPAPSGKVINLSDIQAADKGGVVVKHFCNISFEKFTMYVLLQMASSNHYTNGDGYDYTIRTHIS